MLRRNALETLVKCYLVREEHGLRRDGSIEERKELHTSVTASEASAPVCDLHDETRGI